MQIIKRELTIDFVGQAKFWIAISSILMVVSLISFFTKGFNYGIDFSGGTAINLKFDPKAGASADKIRKALESINMQSASVQDYGSKESNEFLIKVGQSGTQLEDKKSDFLKAIDTELASNGNKVELIRFSPDKMYITLVKEDDPAKLKIAIDKMAIADLKLKSVDSYGKSSNREYLAEFSGITQMINSALTGVFGENAFQVLKVDIVGPKVGGELRRDAILASFLALFFILIYVWLRFELEFAPGAVLCLLHDALITAGIFSLFGLEIDATFIAAILTIVGYSINDTIVVYDRIRENRALLKNESFATILNRSINQTLSRTILTSLTVFFVVVILLIYGGPILFTMSLALTIGVFIGSYSTIFIATPLTLFLHNRFFVKKTL